MLGKEVPSCSFFKRKNTIHLIQAEDFCLGSNQAGDRQGMCLFVMEFFTSHHYEPSLVKNKRTGISLEVQWLRLRASTEGDTGSVPGQGTKILHAAQCGQNEPLKIIFKF